MNRRTKICCVACLLLLASRPTHAADAGALGFEVTFDQTLRSTPFSGRVYILLNDKPSTPLLGKLLHRPPGEWPWTSKQPIFSLDVEDCWNGAPRLVTRSSGKLSQQSRIHGTRCPCKRDAS